MPARLRTGRRPSKVMNSRVLISKHGASPDSLLDKVRSYKFLFMELQHWSAEDSGIGRWRSFSPHPAVFSVTHVERGSVGYIGGIGPTPLHVWGRWPVCTGFAFCLAGIHQY